MTVHHPRPGVRVDGNTVNLSSREVISETISRLQQAGEGFRTPLLRAARDGLINLVMAHGGQRIASHALKFERPTVILLADDHPGAIGPDGWPQVVKLLRWARSGLFHAAAGHQAHYLAAAIAADTTGRTLMVEMEFRHHQAWLELSKRVAPQLRLLNILPTGGIHPISGPPAGEVIQ